MRLFPRFPSLPAIEFCDFCCCFTPLSHPSTPLLAVPRSHLLLCCTPSLEGWEVCLASWLGNRFSCGQKYDYGVERSGTLLSPGLIGCSPLPTGPALFVNGKRVIGILCRIVLRATIIAASEAVFIGLSLCSRRVPVIFGEQKNQWWPGLFRDFDESYFILFSKLKSKLKI